MFWFDIISRSLKITFFYQQGPGLIRFSKLQMDLKVILEIEE